MAAQLHRRGARVVGLVRDEVPESTFVTSGLRDRVTVVRGNLEDLELLQRVVVEHEIRVVFHLAAQAIVGVANRSPLSTFRSNVQGTWTLLEACRVTATPQAIVMASSDKAYGTHAVLPYREDYPLNPEFPYDVSKACADLIGRSYHKTYGLPVVITRFANIYGPGDENYSRIVPDIVRSALRGEAPIVRSDGTPERDFLYIDDVVDLYMLLAERIQETAGNVFNAGHNQPVRIIDLVRMILRLAGRDDLQPVIASKQKLHGEIDRQWLDPSKAGAMLGWRPTVRLEQGLERTIAWHRRKLQTGEAAAVQ